MRIVSILFLGFFLGVVHAARAQTCVPCAAPFDPNTHFAVCGRWVAIPSCPFRQTWACNTGQPQDPVGWPNGVHAVHMVLLHTGKVLLFRETDNWDPLGPIYYPVIWDPVTFAVTSLAATPAPESWFCAGHVVSSDGRVVIVGGSDTTLNPNNPTGLRKTYLINPTTAQWSYADDMELRRWYPTATVLPDGSLLATDGRETGTGGASYDAADIPEKMFAPTSNWVSLGTAQNPNMTLYPFVHVIPGPGIRVLHAGPELPGGGMQVLEGLQTSSPYWVASASDQMPGGTVAMYDKGKLLKTGGTNPHEAPEGAPAVKATEIISIDPVTGQVSTPLLSEDMADQRIEHNLVTLPDGKVLVVGGGRKAGDGFMKLEDAVYETEIWHPSTSDWCRVAPMTHRQPPNGPIPRMYHSTALLLPDGRVLTAGGEVDSRQGNPPCPQDPGLGGTFSQCRSADFFEPPYLFRASDHTPISQIPSGRPQVSILPQFLAYGEPLSLTASVGSGISGATTISKVSLVRPSAVTHANDMDQRFIPLSPFLYDGPTQALSIAATNLPNPSLAPPGYYMLFVLNNLGHPSVGQFVNLWGIIEPSVIVAVTHGCPVMLTFNVQFDTTIPADVDRVEVYAPNAGCSGTGYTNFKEQAAPSGYHHQVTVTSPNLCVTGTWYVRIQSRKNTSPTSVSTWCQVVNVGNCISCPPGGCRPPCELE